MHGDHEELPAGAVRSLTIAIDFDDTYTAHPEMWAKEDGSIHSAESKISWMEPENGGDRCQAALREVELL